MKSTLIIPASIIIAALIVVLAVWIIDAPQRNRIIELEARVEDLEKQLENKDKLIGTLEKDEMRRAIANYFSDPLSQN